MLTYYGTKKRTAHAAKTVKHGVSSKVVIVVEYSVSIYISRN